MKKSKFSDSQIIEALKRVEGERWFRESGHRVK